MVMAENEAGDDHKEFKSPWKTPVIDGEKAADASVMGTQSRPELGGTQQTPNNPQVADVRSAHAPTGAAGQQKSDGPANTYTSHKQSSLRYHKSGSRRNPNAGPRFPVHLPYYQPPMPPFFHAIVPPPHIAVPGHAYQPVPGPFPGIEPQLVQSGPETTMHAFGPPVQGTDASRNMWPPPRGDPNAYPTNFSNRRPNMQEPSGHLNPGWNHQHAYNPGEPIPMQQRPRPFVRPPFFGPAPGFMVGPNYPGAVCYMPIAPPGSISGPHPPRLVPYPINPGTAMFLPETVILRGNIVKQIEYYFSDENLQKDHYLISLMDDQGWVPISKIADFKRVKRMTTDVQFILDAMLSSCTVEVQGDKIRRRDEWSKWKPASPKKTLSSEALATQDHLAENVADSCVNGDVNEDNSRDSSEENVKFLLNSGCLEHVLPEGNPGEINYKSNSRHAAVQVPSNDLDQSVGVEPARFIDSRVERVELLSDVTIQNVADLSNDFTQTFMLDEELELKQKTLKTLSAINRMDDEDDEMVVNDLDVQRLVIATQGIPSLPRPERALKETSAIR